MSKVSIELDTQENSLVVKVDGMVVDNVSDVSIYKYETYDDEDKVSISITKVDRPENKGDLAVYTRLCASKNEDLKEEKLDEKPVHRSIAKFLGTM